MAVAASILKSVDRVSGSEDNEENQKRKKKKQFSEMFTIKVELMLGGKSSPDISRIS